MTIFRFLNVFPTFFQDNVDVHLFDFHSFLQKLKKAPVGASYHILLKLLVNIISNITKSCVTELLRVTKD
ncbi:unknown [Salmonella phage FelixO1]|uniref:Uncharacterized protein n=1 Tax=Salmonella phage Felix O1 (isolate Felix O1-VT1) TaxID=1283336 RepID=Q6KG59_BPFO1|nr:unknown [Salmonella phage FelixO1]